MAPRISEEDLKHILEHTEDTWPLLRGERLFITGGTGFFGCWLLESFTYAVDTLHLGAQAVVLTRHPDAFIKKVPHLATHPSITLWQGDVRHFIEPAGTFWGVIHAATESSTALGVERPQEMLDVIIEGTRRVLDFSIRCSATNFLLTSSGAVYGPQPAELSHIPEDYLGAPRTTEPLSAYGEGKRVAELLCSLYHHQFGLQAKIARCFAFAGPHLPLDAHFAFGNFMRDALRGGPIVIKGDGTSLRSYLYAADLAIWLWTILLRGQAARPYNVGSERIVSILQLADYIAKAYEGIQVTISNQFKVGQNISQYVPSTNRARGELGLLEFIGYEEIVRRMSAWMTSNA